MFALAPALVSALLLSASVHYDVSARAEVRSRPSYGGSFFLAGDLEVAPSGGLTLSTEMSQLAVSYSPQIYLLQPYTFSSAPDVLHRASLTAQTRFRHSRLFAGESISYGVNDFSTLAFQQSVEDPNAVVVQALPPVFDVFAANSSTYAGYWIELGRSSQFEIVGTYTAGGGMDERSRNVIPFEWGPGGYARFSLETSEADTWRTIARAYDLRFSGVPLIPPGEPLPTPDYYDRRPRYQNLELAEEWFQRISRSLDSEVSLGASAIRSKLLPTDPFRVTIYPVLSADLVHRRGILGQHAEGRLGLRYGPFVDRFLGEVYPRSELTAQVEWPYRPNLRFAGRSGVGVAMGGSRNRGDVAALLEARSTYDLAPQWELAGSFLGATNRSERTQGAFNFQWAFAVAIRFHDRGMF